jgi:hypothetical protein
MSLYDEITTTNKPEKNKLNSKEINISKFTISNKSLENSSIKDEEEIEDNSINENINHRERQLSILLEVYETSYSKKAYKDLIKDIEEKEDLLYQNSKRSFEIKIIKVKGLLKLLLEEYDNFLQAKSKTFHDLDVIIHKIRNEFKIISLLLVNNDSYENEIITQIYCKFLYLLSKISRKREDFVKSLGFISLGINMIKVFIMKKKMASDIKTYKIYCKLILELINLLIGDKNYEQALLYIRLLFKIIEISIKFIYYINNENKQKLSIVKIKKFIKFGGIAYIYAGCCLEQLDDSVQAFEAYKQAKYFLQKSSKLGISFQNLNNITINNSLTVLAEEVFEKFKIKFEEDKIERLNRQKKMEILKKKAEYELLQKEKLMKLKFIANGMIGDPFKFDNLESKLNEKLFPNSVVNDLEKIDDDLMSFVYTYFNKHRKKNISSYKDKMTTKTKKLMSRYEVYNILMSKNFRDFIMKTKKLKFYNPKLGSKSISTIQRYLNNKIQIESNERKRNSNSIKSIKITNNNIESTNMKNVSRNNDNFGTMTTSPSSRKEDDKIIDKFLYKTNKKIKYRNKNLKYLVSQSNAFTERKPKKENYPSFHLSKAKSMVNTRIKYKLKKNFNDLECDFERKHLDKNLMTKNYLRKYSYYDKLSTKELEFHKQILHFKENNTLYNEKRTVEEKHGLIGKDDIMNISLIINENAKENALANDNLNEINLLKDSFSSKENRMSIKMKSAMSKVINSYLLGRKKQVTKVKYINSDEAKEINEKKLIHLDYSIKNINNHMMNIKFLTRKKC